MPDFPVGPALRPFGVLGTYDSSSITGDTILQSGGATETGAAWPANNRAVYVPFLVERQVTAFQIAVEVTAQSGNCDVGIYTEAGTRLVSMGSTAVGAAGIQAFNITDTALSPGTYYAGMSCDNTTAAFIRTAGNVLLWRVCAVRQEALGSVALPATATFATVASAFVPQIAIATVATI